MSPKLINQKKLERAERAREIIKEFMECETIAEFNEIAELHKSEIKPLHLGSCVASAMKRLLTAEINKSFNRS